METDFPKLEADTILNRIDKQREILHLSRNDVASIAGLNPLSFINNFKKHKVPKFNDLYRISNALGITFDSLVSDEEPAYVSDKTNVIYWLLLSGKELIQSSLLLRSPDKNAIVRAFNSLSEGLDAVTLIRKPEAAVTSDEYRFCIFHEFMLAEEVDELFLTDEIIQIIRESYSLKRLRKPVIELYKAYLEMTITLWQYSYLPVAAIWQAIDDRISLKYDYKSKFYKDSGISSRSYSEYQDAMTTKASPSTDTMMKALKLLDIDNVDEAIRARIPDASAEYTHSNLSSFVNFEPLSNEILKKDLKTIPYLAQFIDSIFSLGFNDLAQIKSLTDSATKTPYSDYCSDKWTLTLTPGYESAPEDVAPPNLPGKLLMLDYGKDPIHTQYTPEKK